MVSVTVSFDPEKEGGQIEHAIAQFAPSIKSVSFLPNRPGVYEQMPYEAIDKENYDVNNREYKIDWGKETTKSKEDSSMPRGCTNDVCTR